MVTSQSSMSVAQELLNYITERETIKGKFTENSDGDSTKWEDKLLQGNNSL